MWIPLFLAAMSLAAAGLASDWPGFRGPDGRSVAEGAEPPTHFGRNSNEVWHVTVPLGHSSPILSRDRLFLTGIESNGLVVLAFDRADGQLLWKRSLPVEKLEPTHRLGSPAAPTPVADGERVYCYFGSMGLVAFDYSGKELWRRPLPPPVVEFGTSSSPMLAGGRLVIVCDQDEGSYLLAVDPKTGETVWRVDRSELRRGYSTPFVWSHDGDEELIVSGSVWLKSYSAKDGAERWTYTGTSRVANSSPAAGDGLLYVASWNLGGDAGSRLTMPDWPGFAADNDANHDGVISEKEVPEGLIRQRFSQIDFNKDGKATREEWEAMAMIFSKARNAVIAIRPGGHGEISGTHLAWDSTRSLPYVSSPLFHRGRLFTMKNGGLASAYEARTGRVLFQDERVGVGGDYYSSAVACGERVFVGSQSGTVVVLRASDRLEVLGRNDLGEEIMATPAIADGRIYIRTATQLFAFGTSDSKR